MTFEEWFAGERNEFDIYHSGVIRKAWDYQQARIESLEAENFSLAAWQCPYKDGVTGLTSDDYGHQYCAKQVSLERVFSVIKHKRSIGMGLIGIKELVELLQKDKE